MNLTELIKKTSKRTNIAQEDIKNILKTALTIIMEELQVGNRITLRDFFSIHPTQVKGHTIEKKDKRILIPRHTRYYFKLSKHLKK